MLFCLSACGETEISGNPPNTPSESQTDTVKDNDENTFSQENSKVSSNTEETNENDITQTQTQTNQSKPTSTTNQPTHTHSYSNATCTSPKKCSCGATAGIALGHQFSSVTCTSPQICSRCGSTSGNALGHSYSSANCNSPKTCTRCGQTSGSALGHNYVNNKCSRCGKVDPDSLPVALNTISCIDSHNYSYRNTIKDSYGNMYSGCNYFANYSTSYAVFYLNSKFSNFSCDIIAHENMASSGVAIIEFYVDDELVHSVKNYTRTTGKENVNISTINGEKLTVRVYRTGGLAGGNIGLVNTQLKK